MVFSFSNFINEIRSFKKVSSGFIENPGILDAYKDRARQIRNKYRGGPIELGIFEENPLYTTVSDGEYNRSGEGEHKVRGKITSVWDVKPILEPNKSEPSEFRIAGKASTKVCILSECNERISMWRVEVGVEDSPGTHFHVQVEGDDENLPFPESISVPRLPSVLVTVPDAIDFLLGELFQESWIKRTSKQSDAMKQWRPHQQRRLSSLLNWKAEQVKDTMGSAWIAIKDEKPDPGLFLQND